MQYADSLRQVLLRKISKAEQDLMQLKLDYCRFVFGLSHRSQVTVGGDRYQVRHVDIDSMERDAAGEFTRPRLQGSRVDGQDELIDLGREWEVAA